MEAEREQQSAILPPFSLLRALRDGLRAGWDHLGLVVAVSITCTLLTLVALSVGALPYAAMRTTAGQLLSMLALLALLCGPTAGVFSLAYRISTQEPVSFLDFWRDAARFWRPAFGLGVVYYLFGFGFAGSLSLYQSIGGLFGTTIAVVWLYMLLVGLMMAVYHGPLLILQESGAFDTPEKQAKRGIFAVLRRAFFLTFLSPFATFGLLIVLLLVAGVLMATGVLAVLLLPGLLPLLATYPTRALLIRYGALPAPVVAEVVPDERFRMKLHTTNDQRPTTNDQ